MEENSSGRRRFLGVVLAATAGSVVTGAGLGLLRPGEEGPLPAAVPTAAPAVVPSAGKAANVDGELLARLAAAEAENVRLQAALDAAERQLAAVAKDEQAAGSEVALLRGDLASSQERAGLLAGLLTLYEELDQLDLGEAVSRGIDGVAGQFAELVAELPGLEDGLAAGERALAGFEADLPSLEAGRSWLGEQLARLALTWELIEDNLAEALQTAEPVLNMIRTWFDKILSWVPFEWGTRAGRISGAMIGLLEEAPRTIAGGQLEVLVPLDKWLKPEAGEVDPAVRTRLLRPVREQTIAGARRTAEKVKLAETRFQEELVAVTATAAADRQEIRRRIDRYRQEHGL